jgi:hypothetical protein
MYTDIREFNIQLNITVIGDQRVLDSLLDLIGSYGLLANTQKATISVNESPVAKDEHIFKQYYSLLPIKNYAPIKEESPDENPGN